MVSVEASQARDEFVEHTKSVFKNAIYQVSDETRRCAAFDFIARKQINHFTRILITKVLMNIDNFKKPHSVELRFIAHLFSGSPILVSPRSSREAMSDNVVYERHGISAVNLQTLRTMVGEARRTEIHVARRGGFLVQVSGERIKEARRKLDLSIEDLASKADISVRSVQSYETGSTLPSQSTAEKLKEILGDDIIESPEFFREPPPEAPHSGVWQPRAGFKREVSDHLEELGFEAFWFRSAPFDAVSALEKGQKPGIKGTPLITGVSTAISPKDLRKMRVSASISEVSKRKVFWVVAEEPEDSSPKKGPIPLLTVDELEKMKKRIELFRAIDLT